MKKRTKIIICVLLAVIIVGCGLYYKITNNSVNTNSPSNSNLITNEQTQNNVTTSGRIVMVNGTLYYDANKESTIQGRCGNSDGKITSNISSNEIPTENNQANFEGNYEYQYGEQNTIEIKINDKWYVFKAKENSEISQKKLEGKEGISSVLSLEDKIQENTIWCGTFQLIWNDLKNDLAKQDIVFNPQLKVV